jgi:hypothetical protein
MMLLPTSSVKRIVPVIVGISLCAGAAVLVISKLKSPATEDLAASQVTLASMPQPAKGTSRSSSSQSAAPSPAAEVAAASLPKEPASLSEIDLNSASPQVQAEVAVARITRQAQEKLRDFSPESPAMQSPEDRAAFHEQMRSATPEQRQQLMQKQREAMMAARTQQENALIPEQKQQRDRLQKIAQLGGLLRSARQFSWAAELRPQADAFEKAVAHFASTAEGLSEEGFATAWTDLQESHHQVLAQGQALQQSIQRLATAATP